MRIAVLYHYMFPDDVVSAEHFDGLSADLSAQGWQVEALPCNRGCRDERRKYPSSEVHNGVNYNRVWRPRLRQASFVGRVFNSIWMILAWSKLAFRPEKQRPDVVLIGTDPIFGLAVALPLKLFAPNIRVAHWCFDLHPEAAIASGMISSSNLLSRVARKLMKLAYRRCDIIADIGPCMRRHLRRYCHKARETELTPWALKEPSFPLTIDEGSRRELFGTAKLGILYSGNFGEAHTFKEILSLARALIDFPEIHFCFAVRGNNVDALKRAVKAKDTNISFAGFASIEDLEKRLSAADIHIATLKPKWSGIAVPSKFFGSLAIGRPVLFGGEKSSAIGQWIEKYNVGWVVGPENIDQIANEFRRLAHSREELRSFQQRAHETYAAHFSRSIVTEKWNLELLRILKE